MIDSNSRKRRWPLVAGVLIPLLAAVYTFKSFTMPIFAQESIAELFELDVNGDAQYLLVRGVDRKQPVMLFVHGGPGMPAMFLAHLKLKAGLPVDHWSDGLRIWRYTTQSFGKAAREIPGEMAAT